MEKLEASHGVLLQWKSFELRPQGSPPVSPEYLARIEAGTPRLNTIAREQYGIEMKRGPFGINSRPALVGAKLAEAAGRGPEYHAAVFHAYWIEGEDISDLSRLVEIAESVGLDPEAFRMGLNDPAANAAVQDDIDLARDLGLNGVPAIVFNEKYLVSGAQPYSVLVELTERVQRMQE